MNREQMHLKLKKSVFEYDHETLYSLLQCRKCFDQKVIDDCFIFCITNGNVIALTYFISSNRVNLEKLDDKVNGLLHFALSSIENEYNSPRINEDKLERHNIVFNLLISSRGLNPGYVINGNTVLMRAIGNGLSINIISNLLLTKMSRPEYINARNESAYSMVATYYQFKSDTDKICEMISDEIGNILIELIEQNPEINSEVYHKINSILQRNEINPKRLDEMYFGVLNIAVSTGNLNLVKKNTKLSEI